MFAGIKRKAYEEGYDKGFSDGVRLAEKIAVETITEIISMRQEELVNVSPGGTDCGDE